MKKVHFLLTAILVTVSFTAVAQEKEPTEKEKLSYYEQRAKQDAAYEQSTEVALEDEEEFWEDQKAYEKNLRKRDKKAYRAYMRGKRDAYAEHAEHCNSHCHHSDYYHSHTTYYYSYNNYRRAPRRSTVVRTNVGIRVPSVRIGL
ncbi:hypothetical protein AX016_2948 [Cellulophaga sp. RHA19]|uniref:hypothetical protein n=1 Tax=Cellulophaga sp. RHA19 TaxID=1798237 RepID=UPI000C2BE7CE|nr:hypothetical protein [Cellulophaga sp. RHA19]PKB44726.1 hypothetical protein AX016_2948 [Cellulophaga sp. RHA19]